ncbi:hypothetical protein [Streptosporangium sp. NPDC000396]
MQAKIISVSGFEWVSPSCYVELDGCRNFVHPGGTFGRLTPEAVALLAD